MSSPAGGAPAVPAALRPCLAAGIFGLWAAAIALAPGLVLKAALLAPALLIPLAWWTLLLPGRWISLFFATALLLPPLPIAIGDSGPHVCLLFVALGMVTGALWAAEWRIEPGAVGTPLLVLFGILLASVAPAAWYSGAGPAVGSLARVALFGISLLVF